MNTDEHRLNQITEKIIACGYKVSNGLGCGFLEKVYENLMVLALRKAGLHVEQQIRFKVSFEGAEVGEYVADLVVQNLVLNEIKAVQHLDEIHEAQCLNQLAVTGLPIYLMMNFAKPKLEIRRIVGKSFPHG